MPPLMRKITRLNNPDHRGRKGAALLLNKKEHKKYDQDFMRHRLQ